MKYRFLIYLMLAVMTAACSNDEPEVPAEKHPSKAEFERIVQGRTWAFQETAYIDSQGRVIPDFYGPCGPAEGYTAFAFNGNLVTTATPGYMSLYRNYSSTFTYS